MALNIQLPARDACSALKEIRPKRLSVAKDDRNFLRDNTLSYEVNLDPACLSK